MEYWLIMHNIDQIFFNWQHILIREVREAFQCQWASLQKVEVQEKGEKSLILY